MGFENSSSFRIEDFGGGVVILLYLLVSFASWKFLDPRARTDSDVEMCGACSHVDFWDSSKSL